MAKIDLTKRSFGKLEVVKENPVPYISPGGKRVRRWDCVCECGNELTVLQNALTGKNGTRSCGCVRKEFSRNTAIDLTDRFFGRLKVIKRVEWDKPQTNGLKTGWLCKCECGNEKIFTQKMLMHSGGRVQSCGCLLSETAKKRVLVDNAPGFFEGSIVSAILPNRKANKNSTSGVKGVYWSAGENAWVACIGFKNKKITLGRFHDLEDAVKARKEAEEKYFVPLIEKYNAIKNNDE